MKFYCMETFDLVCDKTNKMTCTPREDGRQYINPVTSESKLCTKWEKRDIWFHHEDSEKVSELDQEIPQSHTADQPAAP